MAVTIVAISENFRLIERGEVCLLYKREMDIYGTEYWKKQDPVSVMQTLFSELYKKALVELGTKGEANHG